MRSGESRPPDPPVDEQAGDELPPARGLRIKGLTVTRRAAILVVVVIVLALSYASTLRVYVSQQHELAVAQQEIRDRTAQVSQLQGQLDRWDDPAYVKAQARERLGWVMPGEVGYRVVDEDGEPVGGGVAIESQNQLPTGEQAATWWERLWGSVQAADAPQRKVTIK